MTSHTMPTYHTSPRSQVTQALTLPTTRSLCQARGTVLYITKSLDLFTSSGFKGRPKKVCKRSCSSLHFSNSFLVYP